MRPTVYGFQKKTTKCFSLTPFSRLSFILKLIQNLRNLLAINFFKFYCTISKFIRHQPLSHLFTLSAAWFFTVGILEYNTLRQDPFLLPVKIILSKHGDSWKIFLFQFVWLNSAKSTYFYFLAKFTFYKENPVTQRLSMLH